jgi:VanZ family protein
MASPLWKSILKYRATLSWIAAAMVILVIFIAADAPARNLPKELRQSQNDGITPELLFWKTMHLAAFFVLSALLVSAMTISRRNAIPDRLSMAAAFFISVAVAASKELLQHEAPGRVPRLLDVGIDVTGMLLGITAACVIWRHGSELSRRLNPDWGDLLWRAAFGASFVAVIALALYGII